MTFEGLTPYRIMVCVDCYFVHHGMSPEQEPDREPWGLIDSRQEVTSGMPAGHHECRGETREVADGCECEHVTFSWSSCDGCGSTLGGAREYMTLWSD